MNMINDILKGIDMEHLEILDEQELETLYNMLVKGNETFLREREANDLS